MTKTEKILNLLKQGKTPAEVSTALNVPKSFVYNVKSRHLNGKKTRKKRMRATANTTVLPATASATRSTARYSREQIQHAEKVLSVLETMGC